MKIVIVGAGEVGFHLASRLALENKDVVVIDNKPEALKRLSESIDVQTINASGSSPFILRKPVSRRPKSCWPSPIPTR